MRTSGKTQHSWLAQFTQDRPRERKTYKKRGQSSLSPVHWGSLLFVSFDRRALTPRRWIFLLLSKSNRAATLISLRAITRSVQDPRAVTRWGRFDVRHSKSLLTRQNPRRYTRLTPSSPLLLAFPQLLSNHPGGWQHPLNCSLGSPHSHLEARNRRWLWHFLFVNMAGDIFISHSSVPTLCRLGFSPCRQGIHILVGEKGLCQCHSSEQKAQLLSKLKRIQ